ncbi:MAG: polysaccharide deacetylase family protein [Myxococcales bacterium]|nr:polysaccharide deacetylase family protein [Myxococcales bacterium]
MKSGRDATPACQTAVSVDLDEIHHYARLHGLPARREGPGLVYRRALERLGELALGEGLRMSLFAVGEDVADAAGAAALRPLCAAGHAVENHSYTHPYAFAALPEAALSAEIEGAQAAILAATGRRPLVFRAPGYAACDALFDALERSGIALDASVFPCPAYYAAKAAAVAALRLRGHRSAAVLHRLAGLRAPTAPYRVGRPWHRRGERGVVELPVQVTPILRLPVIGTTLTAFGRAGARALARAVARRPFVSLELHGIDLLDATDGLDELARYQPDVRIPVRHTLARLRAALAVLRAAGHAFVRLDEAAVSVGT